MNPHLAQQTILQFLRPAAAHKVRPAQFVVAADGAIVISDSPQPDHAAPIAAPVPASAGAAPLLRRRRITDDDDDEVQSSPFPPRARSPTAPVPAAAGAALPNTRRRITDDNDVDDEVQPSAGNQQPAINDYFVTISSAVHRNNVNEQMAPDIMNLWSVVPYESSRDLDTVISEAQSTTDASSSSCSTPAERRNGYILDDFVVASSDSDSDDDDDDDGNDDI